MQSPNVLQEKRKKVTLMEYFKSLPRSISPRKALIDEIVKETGKTEQTVRNWCIYGMRPQDYNDVKVLSRITKIPEEELWTD